MKVSKHKRRALRQSAGKSRLLLLTGLLVAIGFASGALLAQQDPDPGTADERNMAAGEGTAGDGDTAAAGQAAPADGVPGRSATALDSAIPSSPWQIAEAMGIPFTVIFVLASVIATWSAIERLVLLRTRRVIPRAFVDRFLMHLRSGRLEKPEALAICQQNQSPVADIFLHGVRKWGRPSVEIEQAVIDGGERQVSLLKKRLRILNGVATVTPLIGLLGTVIGMIQAFNDIATADAMGQAQQLAGGIAMALLTTAAGLFIAIPALIVYMFLAGRIDLLVMEMDRLGQELVHLISAEALRERAMIPADAAPRRAAAPASAPAGKT